MAVDDLQFFRSEQKKNPNGFCHILGVALRLVKIFRTSSTIKYQSYCYNFEYYPFSAPSNTIQDAQKMAKYEGEQTAHPFRKQIVVLKELQIFEGRLFHSGATNHYGSDDTEVSFYADG